MTIRRSRTTANTPILVVILLFLLIPGTTLLACHTSSDPFWDADIWLDPERPFLYYADKKSEQPAKKATRSAPKAADDFSSFQTVEALQAEAKRRLNTAIMTPTPANMLAYQAINSHLLALSHRFSDAWRLSNIAAPQYDWTATHPTLNAATTALAAQKERRRKALVKSLAQKAGLIFVANATDELSVLFAPIVVRFAKDFGFELLTLETTGRALPGIPKTLPERGFLKRMKLTQTPALLLVMAPGHKAPAAFHEKASLTLATGVVSALELEKRILFLMRPTRTLENARERFPTLDTMPNDTVSSLSTLQTTSRELLP